MVCLICHEMGPGLILSICSFCDEEKESQLYNRRPKKVQNRSRHALSLFDLSAEALIVEANQNDMVLIARNNDVSDQHFWSALLRAWGRLNSVRIKQCKRNPAKRLLKKFNIEI